MNPMIMEEQQQQEQQKQENALDSFSGPRNSKRQRRPSVRLGEIGDVPLALFLENRPYFKRRKKRAVGAAAAAALQVCSSLLPDVVEEVEEEQDDDPTAVDMTGFHLQESVESPPLTKKTKALELVHDAEERKSGENGNEAEMIEQLPEVEHDHSPAANGENEEEKGGGGEERKRAEEKKKKKRRRRGNGGSGGKKGRKKSSSSSSFTVKNWRARKVLAAGEGDGSKSSSLGKEEDEARESKEEEEEEEEAMEEAREEEVQEEEEEELLPQEEELELEDKNNSQGMFDQANESDALVEALDPEERLVEEDGNGGGGDGENFLAREENRLNAGNRDEEQEEEAPETRTQTINQEESFVLPELVRKWLEERRLAKYMDAFELHEVDEEALPLLTMEDLREMGIHAVGSRRRMFHAILSLSSRRSD